MIDSVEKLAVAAYSAITAMGSVPLFADIAPPGQNYPFAVYTVVATPVAMASTCDTLLGVVQYSLYSNGGLEATSVLASALFTGLHRAEPESTGKTLVRCVVTDTRRLREEHCWRYDLDVSLWAR